MQLTCTCGLQTSINIRDVSDVLSMSTLSERLTYCYYHDWLVTPSVSAQCLAVSTQSLEEHSLDTNDGAEIDQTCQFTCEPESSRPMSNHCRQPG